MHGIYTYIPETNCVPREYSVAAILLLLFMVLISLVSVLNLLYFYISTFRSVCAVPNMAVFCSSLTSCFPGIIIIIIIIIIIVVVALLNTAWQNSIISTLVGPIMLTVQAMYIYVCGLSPYKLDRPSPSNVYFCLWSVSFQIGPTQSQ